MSVEQRRPAAVRSPALRARGEGAFRKLINECLRQLPCLWTSSSGSLVQGVGELAIAGYDWPYGVPSSSSGRGQKALVALGNDGQKQ